MTLRFCIGFCVVIVIGIANLAAGIAWNDMGNVAVAILDFAGAAFCLFVFERVRA